MKQRHAALDTSELNMALELATKPGTEPAVKDTAIAQKLAKPSMPRGSAVFQEVLKEIHEEEKEVQEEKARAEKPKEEKMEPKPRQRLSSTSESQKIQKTDRWRVAKMKFFQRTKSQRELLLQMK